MAAERSGGPGMSGQKVYHGWVGGWDASPTLAAAPRWTMGNSDYNREGKTKFKDTFLDKHSRSVAWVPGCGTHRVVRMYEGPEEEARSSAVKDKKEKGPNTWESSQYSAQNHSYAGGTMLYKIPRQTRVASLPDLKSVRKTLMPTSFLTPGPGAYTAYSTFGQPSGPTRKRYLATNPGDNFGLKVRTPEKYERSSDRG
eukprot:gnl/TRDRNA2_/TRDRNA2_43263_c0_seq1.p1 gnl/TRDRNA2_/TRDRNA2_43263_c0~~gnl/TRDRNA2_/TRDRNA2_43263_c0_seq1.p1  ORF type:complete len:231 (+),score=17.06 gnl/TRDRNA2_/TRDRNA2_43263_c0_seq1:100-693(+)